MWLLFFSWCSNGEKIACIRPWVAEKQHGGMFSVANFVASKKCFVMKRFLLNIALLKNDFREVI